MKNENKSFIRLSVLAFSIAAFGALANDASASEKITEPQSVKTTVFGQGSASFDWMAGGQAEDDLRNQDVLTNRPVGNGSWICSPAGFGRQARCFRR